VLAIILIVSRSIAGQWIGFGQSNSIGEDGGPVYVIGHDGKIYLNAFDLSVGGMQIKNIAVWDGVRWRDTTTGIEGNSISSMLIDNNGQLLICASVDPETHQYSPYRSCVLRWDGTKWNTVGGGLDGVISITIDTAGTIYACRKTGYQSVVVRYNGSSWDRIGGEDINCMYGKIMFDQQGTLWVSGSFNFVENIPAEGIARWDGNAWQPTSNGLLASKTDGIVNVSKLLLCKGTVYATGEFYTSKPDNICGLAKWDGTSWCSVGNLHFSYVLSAGADSTGNLYVSGYVKDSRDSTHSIVAVWNGTQWKQLGELDEGPETLIVDYSGNVYGYFGSNYDLVVWRDNAWKPAVTENGLNGEVTCVFADTARGYVYVGGGFSAAGGTTVNNIARWDGQKWEAFDNGTIGYVSAITGNASGDIFACAEYGIYPKHSVVRFSKGRWDDIGQLNDRSYCNTLVFDTSGILYAGGTFNSIGGVAARRIACWNGTEWKALGTGINGDEVNAIAFDKSGKLYAGGKFEVAGSTVAHNIAMWDGISWQPLGEGIRKDPTSFYPVNALAVDRAGNVYVGGDFTQAGNTAASNIARWDGTTWYALAEGISTRYYGVKALTINPSGILFAGGSIYRAGNESVNGIAQWDGQRWSALDEGVYSWDDTIPYPGPVNALFCDNTTLHVAGSFEKAGRLVSCHFAQYRFDPAAARILQRVTPAMSTISFDRQHTALRLHLNSDTRVHVSTINLMGKLAGSTNVKLARGKHLVPITSNALPCGVYIVRVKAGGHMSSYRFVVER